jgi:hypothetical protein
MRRRQEVPVTAVGADDGPRCEVAEEHHVASLVAWSRRSRPPTTPVSTSGVSGGKPVKVKCGTVFCTVADARAGPATFVTVAATVKRDLRLSPRLHNRPRRKTVVAALYDQPCHHSASAKQPTTCGHSDCIGTPRSHKGCNGLNPSSTASP